MHCARRGPRGRRHHRLDSDFAPLVMHLRDRGCRVEGVGQEGKVGAESHPSPTTISCPRRWVGAGRWGRRRWRPPPRRTSRAAAAAPPDPAAVVPGDVERWLERGPRARVGRKRRAQGRRRGAAQGKAALAQRVVDDAVQEASGLVRADSGPAAELGTHRGTSGPHEKAAHVGRSLKRPLRPLSMTAAAVRKRGLTSAPRRRQPAAACRPSCRLRSAPCAVRGSCPRWSPAAWCRTCLHPRE